MKGAMPANAFFCSHAVLPLIVLCRWALNNCPLCQLMATFWCPPCSWFLQFKRKYSLSSDTLSLVLDCTCPKRLLCKISVFGFVASLLLRSFLSSTFESPLNLRTWRGGRKLFFFFFLVPKQGVKFLNANLKHYDNIRKYEIIQWMQF